MRIILAIAVLILFSTTSYASRCDCSKRLGPCSANVDWKSDLITVKSSSNACSRVDWYANGYPHLTVVMDGIDEQAPLNIMPGKGIPEILVESCYVCKDENLEPGSSF